MKRACRRLMAATWLKRLGQTKGLELLEFAFALPLLVVIAIGIIDFGGAYQRKDVLTNAAREAARMVASNDVNNPNCACTFPSSGGSTTPSCTPCSIDVAADAVQQYLTNAGLSQASCLNSATAARSANMTWTYSCNSVTLQIQRANRVTSGSVTILSTQVTLSYPYTWSFGRVIELLAPSSTISPPTTLTASAVMANLN